ncbi:hypothetical protein [uncultured Flavobacterium sp.]|uniref:hypothetical protein n=1 Tax=uncultured Flavobacterium sp. TaxID=165435 RepID=UPI0025DD0F00|nr:hypothetical protein [uncultured Flavobacterium sp.]
MKISLLKSVAFLLFATAFTSCSTESAVDLTNDTAAQASEKLNRSSLWEGEIGIENNGNYEITADKNILLADLQIIADKENVTLETLEIVKKQAINDPNDTSFMLIATNNGQGYSVGVQLKNQSGIFRLDSGFQQHFPAPVAVSCQGCASGCNLQYLYIEGKRVPICNENGCIADCKKTETEIN